VDWFAGQTAVVTGAAHGIGRASAELLEQLGARVVAVDIDGEALESAFGDTAVANVVADIGGDGRALAELLSERYGPIELLVNNVGIETPRHFLELGESEFDKVFAVNLRGPWFLTRALADALIATGRRGSIVFVSSLHDTFIRTFPHYSTSKAAVAMLVKELASELGPHGIRVNAVSPGAIHSAHVPLPTDEPELHRLRELIPLGHIGEPQQVARMIAVLLSDEWANYVTGANVRVDGGLGTHSWSAHRPA
jgi:NAD(P)-dependent dehydrogenase (short-subunit alcohol dehydrogenase family)